MNPAIVQQWKRQERESIFSPRVTPWPRGETNSTHMLAWRKELRARAASILGANGVARFEEFRSYRDGWNFGQGKALTRSSILRMEFFLSHYPVFEREPSLFLTESGNLLLGWEDGRNNPIELEFTREGYLLYLASTDEERAYRSTELGSLLEALPPMYAHGAP